MADLSQRFNAPLYTVAEAARFVGVPTSTFATWGRGYTRDRPGGITSVGAPVVTFAPAPRGQASVPFIGLAEGLVLAAIREAGVPLQRIRPALALLQDELGFEHVLASKRLFTDGAEVLYDYAERTGDTPEGRSVRELVVVRHGQRVFAEVVETYLRGVEFDTKGYARLIRLPRYGTAQIVADPDRGFGQPIFTSGGARLEDVLAMFRSGEPLRVVSEEYGVPLPELEDAVRVALRAA
ncbi:hypothetical protein [Actinospica sp.]|jgi:uncharacterized protein (DUF433 family)|uniref:DUF433 domain-containing protein n=1 Tax=Actinospica sp. TaxID=1872142 RepID=UPI002C9A8696|nr:hypothetical protein [Actinospica sp.]HEX3614043.1 hypothetical protein [Sporichthyaceae bacterium]HWG27238.1 hypothetical protein [Actinospica sp.]